MAVIDLERMIFDLYRGGLASKYHSDPQGFVSQYDLSDTERRLALDKDYNALYDHGVHPMMVMYFARLNGLSVPDYLQLLRQGTKGAGDSSRV